jgi:hypothetical protein
MTSDYRTTSDFIPDILDALERHGYVRSHDQHVGRAIGLIGGVARIYEGSLDAPRGAHVMALASRPKGPPPPGPSVVVSVGEVKTLLAALDDAAEYKRDQAETCADCTDQSCTTCRWRLQAAGAYDQMAEPIIQAAEASAVRQPTPDHAAPGSDGPHPAAENKAGQ